MRKVMSHLLPLSSKYQILTMKPEDRNVYKSYLTFMKQSKVVINVITVFSYERNCGIIQSLFVTTDIAINCK